MKQQVGGYAASHRAGQGAVFLCAVLWSTSGLFIKLVDWHPLVIAGTRSFLAVLLLLAFKLWRAQRAVRPGAKKAPTFQREPGLFGIPGFSVYTLAGGIAYAATMVSFVIANKLTASANAVLLQYSAPIWTALLGWLIAKEKLRWEHWGALVLVMGGMVLFFKDGLSGGALLGDCIAIFSGIAFGAQAAFMRMIKDGDPADSMLLAHIFTALAGLPFIFIYPPALSGGTVLAVLFMGFIQIGAASLLFSYGIKRVTAIQAMLTAMIEPVLNPVWVLLVTGERPTVSALIGGGIIITAVVGSSVIGRRRR
ncbi:membrane protein [Spirochaetia bacterium]|nr:membrane protein [Spirochaetia bacterium]